MIVNDERRFVFVHIPKVAGTSIRRALRSLAGSRSNPLGDTKHATAGDLRAALGAAVEGYRFFAFVRNPWDRFASFHRYLWKRGLAAEHRIPEDLNAFALMLESRDDWLEARHSIRPQSDFVDDSFFLIGRYERLAEDFDRLCAAIDAQLDLPRANATKGSDYRRLFNDRSAGIIAERYAGDIARFGYAFEA